MAFFSDGLNEYFSLTLNPAKNDRARVYRLSDRQRQFSEFTAYCMLGASGLTIFTILAFGMMEMWGLVPHHISNVNQELIVLTVAALAVLITFLQLIIFVSLRTSNQTIGNRSKIQKELCAEQIIPHKSLSVYLIFLTNLLTPFLALAALPGGLPGLIAEFPSYGPGYKLFISQVFLGVSIFIIFLSRRIFFLSKLGKARE